MKWIWISVFWLFLHGVSAQEVPSGIKVKKDQQRIIAELSGKLPLDSKTGLLTQRSTPKERRLVADYLFKRLLEAGLSVGKHHYKSPNSVFVLDLLFRPFKGTNVYGIVPATNASEEYVIFGGHYDSERGSPGAIDNATGMSMGLLLARELLSLKERKVNYMVVFFDQEEDDEVGSKAFVKWLLSEGYKVHSVHTIDTVGWDEDGDGAISIQSPTEALEKRYVAEGARLGVKIEVAGGASSDNGSFMRAGFETVGVSESFNDTTPYIHTPEDRYDTVDFNYLARATELILNVLKSISYEQ